MTHPPSAATSTLALLCCLFIAAGSHGATSGHYRWTDNNGQVQYSDRPPAGVDSEFIKFATGTRSKVDAAPSDQTPNPNSKQVLPTMVEVAPKKDPALCKQAKHNLKAMDSARIRITEADGSKHFLTEQEREGQRENARKFIKINC